MRPISSRERAAAERSAGFAVDGGGPAGGPPLPVLLGVAVAVATVPGLPAAIVELTDPDPGDGLEAGALLHAAASASKPVFIIGTPG